MSKSYTRFKLSNGEREASFTVVSNMGLGVLEVDWGKCDPDIRANLEEVFEELSLMVEYHTMALAVARDRGLKLEMSHEGVWGRDGGLKFS